MKTLSGNSRMIRDMAETAPLLETDSALARCRESTATGSVNLLEEMRFGRETYRKMYQEDLPARTIVNMVTVNPARAFRMQKEIGSLSEGRIADILVVNKCDLPNADLFARQGEPYFRSVERDVLRRLLPFRHAVVATGGGTYADADNRALINDNGLSIWLDLPFQMALARVPADGRRPLAADRAQFEALYHQRRLAYQLAHLRLDAASPVEELVERVLDWLGY